jgi:translation initiation factor IF-3
MFKGREIQHRELGLDQLKKFVELVGDTAKVEAPVHSDGRRITVTLAPK